MDYDGLKALVASYLHRTDLTSLMETFIEHGRLRLSDRLRVPEMETYATVTLTSGVGALSSDVAEVRTVKGSRMELLPAPLPQVVESSSEGLYAIVGLDLYAPGCGSATVYYWERPQTLVGAAGSATRAVLSLYPTVWLYAALVEAYFYLQDSENGAAAELRLDEAITRANVRARNTRHPRPVMSDIRSNVTAAGPGL